MKTLALGLRALGCRFVRPKRPYKLTLSVTQRCNSRCTLCRIWQRDQQAAELSVDEIARFLDRARRFAWVDLTGGEPTLRDDFPALAEVVVRHCPELVLLHFPTNGLDTERVLRQTGEILKARPPRLIVTVSLDGPRLVHDRLRGVTGGFAASVETYRRLSKRSGCEVHFGTTLSAANLGRFEDMVREVEALVPGVGPDDFHVNVAHVSPLHYGNEGARVGDAAQLADEVARVLSLRRRRVNLVSVFDRRYLKGAEAYLRTGRSPAACRALAASCYVASDGTVFPCTLRDVPLGSVRDAEFDVGGLWASPAAEELRREIRAHRCPGCWTPCEAYPSLAAGALL